MNFDHPCDTSRTVFGIYFSSDPFALGTSVYDTVTPLAFVRSFTKDSRQLRDAIARRFTGARESGLLSVIVSNMARPWIDRRLLDDVFGTLSEGEFWFHMNIREAAGGSYSFNVKGYERRGLLRLEIDENGVFSHLMEQRLGLDDVVRAIDDFVLFQQRPPANPDYPMWQLLPEYFGYSRGFRESCPPGYTLPRFLMPYGWTYEKQDTLCRIRPRPLRSEYTNELLVHPHFFGVQNDELRMADGRHAVVYLEESSSDDEEMDGGGPRVLVQALAGETGSIFGAPPRRGDVLAHEEAQ